jgi:hypothetical protein
MLLYNFNSNMDEDHSIIQDLRLKRLQRAAEYALLAAIHLFFLLAFRSYYRWWMALLLGAITFGMNFQLTQIRERRRTAAARNRQRVLADAFESVLFLIFIAALSLGGLLQKYIDVGDQEYLAYVASLLMGLFLAGLVGELFWQAKYLGELPDTERRNYIANLKRTIILPYTITRRR